jgi:hypothetical protein
MSSNIEINSSFSLPGLEERSQLVVIRFGGIPTFFASGKDFAEIGPPGAKTFLACSIQDKSPQAIFRFAV